MTRIDAADQGPLHALPCPIPDCAGTIRCRPTLPAGRYPCPCGAAMLRLRWETYLDARGRRPALLPDEEASPC